MSRNSAKDRDSLSGLMDWLFNDLKSLSQCRGYAYMSLLSPSYLIV